MANVYALEEVFQHLLAGGQLYHEFLRRDALSVGVYHLPAGQPDPQRPHTEDEVYYVLAGEGQVDVGGEVVPVRPGSIIYVGRQVTHRFFDYPDGLTLLVIFAPPRGSAAT